jgi:hypothetical protein
MDQQLEGEKWRGRSVCSSLPEANEYPGLAYARGPGSDGRKKILAINFVTVIETS